MDKNIIALKKALNSGLYGFVEPSELDEFDPNLSNKFVSNVLKLRETDTRSIEKTEKIKEFLSLKYHD